MSIDTRYAENADCAHETAMLSGLATILRCSAFLTEDLEALVPLSATLRPKRMLGIRSPFARVIG